MTTSHLQKIFTKADYTLLMSNLPSAKAHFFAQMFPIEDIDRLTYEAINETMGANIAGYVSTYGSGATEVGYQDVTALTGDINPISIKRIIKEKDIILLDGANDTKISMLRNKIYNNFKFVKEAAFNRLDYYAMQLLSNQGKIVIDSNTNNGHVYDTIEYKLDTWQKPTASVLWTDSANAVPIEDIQAWVDARDEKGLASEYILMGKTAWRNMSKCKSVVAETSYSTGQGTVKGNIVTLEAVNTVLVGALLPKIILVKDEVSYVKSDGTFDNTRRAWNQDNISIVSSLVQGKTFNAPTAEMINKPKSALTGKSDGVTIQQYGNVDPVYDVTKSKMNAMCAWGLSTEILTAKVR